MIMKNRTLCDLKDLANTVLLKETYFDKSFLYIKEPNAFLE